MFGRGRSPMLVLVAAAVLAAAVFAIDINMPLGFAGGVPYVAVVGLGWWLPKRRYIFFLALVSTALTLAGYLYSPPGGIAWVAVSNRVMALFAVWVTAVLLFVIRKEERARKDSEKRVQQAENKLAEAVESLSDAIILLDAGERFVFCNARYREIHNALAAHLVSGTPFEDICYQAARSGVITVVDKDDDEQCREWTRDRLARFRDFGPPEERPLEDGRWVSVRDYKTRDGGIFIIQTDITERKKAGEAVRQSEERLMAILDSIPAMINVKDKDRRYRMTNRTHREFFGYDPDELIGNTASVVTGIDAKRILKFDKSVLETGEIVTYDATRLDAGGRERNMLATKAPLRDSTGEIIGIVTSSIDITERKQAEEALRENEERLQLILENAVSGVITIDEKGVIGTFNAAAEAMFGYSAEEVTGKNVAMLMPEPDHSAHDGYLENYRQTGKGEIIGIGREVEGLRKDGATFPMQLQISELTLGGQRVFTGFIEDISERKKAEEALLESEMRFRDLAESASDWFWEMDRDLRFTYVSDKYYEITGRTPGDIIGKTRLEIADKKTREDQPEAWRGHIEDLEARRPFSNFIQSSPGNPGG